MGNFRSCPLQKDSLPEAIGSPKAPVAQVKTLISGNPLSQDQFHPITPFTYATFPL
jgi:hypothetical protein